MRLLLALVCASMTFGCGGEESEEVETETVEGSGNDSDEDSDEGSEEGDEDSELDEDTHPERDEDSLDLSVHVEEHILDEETTARVAAEQRGIAHILIRHRGGERTDSSVTRSEADAEARAQEALDRVNGGADFATVASEMSDDEANKEHGGEMGRLEQGLLPAPLDEALFSIDVGQVRGPIQTPLGYHVIRRTE